jgi:hypothetical protein
MNEVKKYGIFEAPFEADTEGNPFDIPFSALVTGPDNSAINIPGFYDGKRRFVFRFLPEAEGRFTYETKSPVSALDGKKGSFLCTPAVPESHGIVRVRDRYWFSYEDGTPYFDCGTTCYAWIHQTKDLQKQTLNTLSEGYFSRLRFLVFPKWYEENHREPALYPFKGNPENGFAYDRPNTAFFQHLDECVASLQRLGLQAEIILFHPYEKDSWGFNFMTEREDRRYLSYVIARLSAFSNVWWSLANEYDLIRIGYKKKESAWKHLIRYVRERDPYSHLTSIHQMEKMYDHRDPALTHCSIQRQEMFLTAEYTDTRRKKYKKPVVIDECVYEGNLNAWWGGITGQELVRRFWEATARGGYLGHSEAYAGDNIWWSHGGVLKGESPARIRFLREVMDSCPDIRFSSESGTNNVARAIAGTNTQIVYFGFYQPRTWTLHMLGSGAFRVQIIDTWNMTVDELPEPVRGSAEIPLPGKPYMAIFCSALTPGEAQEFTRDSVFEQMKLTSGGRRLLKIFKRVVPKYYSGMLSLTVNECSALSGGMLDGQAGDGILRIVNRNEFWRGLFQIITGAVFHSGK